MFSATSVYLCNLVYAVSISYLKLSVSNTSEVSCEILVFRGVNLCIMYYQTFVILTVTPASKVCLRVYACVELLNKRQTQPTKPFPSPPQIPGSHKAVSKMVAHQSQCGVGNILKCHKILQVLESFTKILFMYVLYY